MSTLTKNKLLAVVYCSEPLTISSALRGRLLDLYNRYQLTKYVNITPSGVIQNLGNNFAKIPNQFTNKFVAYFFKEEQ